MTAKNVLTSAPPYAVERALQHLAANLRAARLRRNLTVAEVAAKIGTGPRAVSDAEKGKPSTAVAVYLALLWAYDLLDQVEALADAAADTSGVPMSDARQRARPRAPRPPEGLDNDF